MNVSDAIRLKRTVRAITDKAILKQLSECGEWAGHLAGVAPGVAIITPDSVRNSRPCSMPAGPRPAIDVL